MSLNPKCIVFIVLSLLTAVSGFAQADSLFKIWQNKQLDAQQRFEALHAYYLPLIKTKPDSVVYYSTLVIDYSTSYELPNLAKKALLMRGIAYGYLENLDSSKASLDRALIYYTEAQDTFRIAQIFANLGAQYHKFNKFVVALDYYTKALELYELSNDTTNVGFVYFNLGGMLTWVNDYSGAKEFYTKALHYFTATKNERFIASCQNNIGELLRLKGKDAIAIEYIKKALKYFHKTNDSIFISKAYLNLATSYFYLDSLHEKRNALAKKYTFKSIAIVNHLHINQETDLASAYALLGKCYLETNLDSAIFWAEKSFQLLSKKPNKKLLLNDPASVLYSSYKAKNEYQKSLEMLEIVNECSDSLYNDNQRKLLMRELLNYEFKKMRLVEESKFEYERIEQKNKSRIILYTIVLFCLILLVIIYFTNRIRRINILNEKNELIRQVEILKKKQNQLIQEKNFIGDSNHLDWDKINLVVEKKLNDSDRKIMEVLLESPDFSNKEIGQKVFLSSDGVNSSLKKMFRLFLIEGRNKRITLLMTLLKISNT